ncbi:cytochrome b/b6 domain-containing protein [Photobacterium sp. 1_MG-2023]|uniref:cytochrome b/b6 domain-containing protein n=1 Tax=Photobacterium sp. 1_MG-2023 TaxID=3062646 RepID=UPI0026E1886F|nr:cytochrome b/b6 domain-containing protein [Photobacterium sp. 1_MG-2023]MDO6706663.1 cytochrome b/b6 domain-containing protein [Photobacterium sp. 1_MG-2023]
MEKSKQHEILWDRFVRLIHWSVAALFFTNFFFTKEGGETHEWVGYAMTALIIARLLWGCSVDGAARLSSFKPSVEKARLHINELVQTKKDDHHGHNPLGAMMVWFLWGALLLCALSGWAAHEKLFDAKKLFEEIHEFLVNMTLAAVILHIAAVLIMTKLTGNNYLRGMLTGKRSQ